MRDVSPARPLIAPLVIGHRGSSAVAPENTIAAFRRALRDGADGFEFDVRLSRDGVPMVIHDATLERTAQISGRVSDFTSAKLKQTDVGSWFNHQFPNLARQEYGAGAFLYLEMKSDKNQVEALAAAVVALLQKFSFGDRVIVESFNLSALKAIKSLNANIRTAALFEPRLERPISLLRRMKTVELALGVRADEIALHHSLAGRRVIHKAAQSGLPVVVWTIDNPTWFKRALSQGIHALITNDPARMLSERLRWFRV